MSEESTDVIPKTEDPELNISEETNGHRDSKTAVADGEGVSKPAEAKEEPTADNVFQVTIKLPHQPYETQMVVSTQEQVQELRQSVMEYPGTFQYSCFHLEYNGERINDHVELSDVKGLTAGSELKLVEDPYTEKEARMHLIRIRDIVGAASNRVDTLHGISAGLSLHDTVSPWKDPAAPSAPTEKAANASPSGAPHALADYTLDSPPALRTITPIEQEQPPKTIKSLGVSAWNPPPPFLRQQGHLLYLQLTTNEGEQYQITSHISGFFVNRSSNSKFDPFPRPPPKNAAAHSLFSLISVLSQSFTKSFEKLSEANNKRDPLASYQLTNAIPSSPWLVGPTATSLSSHQPDLTRTQETFLLSGVENTETLRDWNEEIQSTRELPRETIQDRVFRERLISKIFAEFNEAAARGAMVVARGEVAPLNPTESIDAQIFVYNNVFYSFGADGVGTFASEGGDEAARVAVGKDVGGVKAVNQLDIAGLATPGTIIVDYLGKRLVAQSIVPGIFKQREPEEHQVDYGGVEGRDVVAENEVFVPTFSQVSKALKVKKHPVWDKKGKKHVLEGSVETKGLLGTDGRKYILDLYRLTPLDVIWLDEHCDDGEGPTTESGSRNYPHRMTTLRPELIEAYWRLKMSEYVQEEVKRRKTSAKAGEPAALTNGTEGSQVDGMDEGTDGIVEHQTKDKSSEAKDKTPEQSPEEDRVDISAFSLSFNPDVFCGQAPQTDEEKEEWVNDEREVRAVCTHLHEKVMPEMINDLKDGDVGFPMDGQSLSRLMHRRGINLRYLGKMATLTESEDARLRALKALTVQEMVSRAFKHVAHRYLKHLPLAFATNCMCHLLNCLLGTSLNNSPKAQIDDDLRDYYKDADYSFITVTPHSLKMEVESQVQIRYQYVLEDVWMQDMRHIQLLRSIALKLGLQLTAREYHFSPETQTTTEQSKPEANGVANGTSDHSGTNGHAHGNGSGKKKEKEHRSQLSTDERRGNPKPTIDIQPGRHSEYGTRHQRCLPKECPCRRGFRSRQDLNDAEPERNRPGVAPRVPNSARADIRRFAPRSSSSLSSIGDAVLPA